MSTHASISSPSTPPRTETKGFLRQASRNPPPQAEGLSPRRSPGGPAILSVSKIPLDLRTYRGSPKMMFTTSHPCSKLPPSSPCHTLLRHASPMPRPFMISRCQAIHREFPEKEIETPHRRGFLLGTSAAVAALVLPQASLAEGGSKALSFHDEYSNGNLAALACWTAFFKIGE